MDDFLKSYLERLKSESSKRSSEIAAGKCNSFEDYKAKCAYVQGLDDALKWCLEARNKALRPEEELPLHRGLRQPGAPLRKPGALYD